MIKVDFQVVQRRRHSPQDFQFLPDRAGTFMFSIVVGEYSLVCHERRLPQLFEHYVRHALLVDEFDEEGDQGEKCVLAVRRGLGWPFLIVTQRCKLPGIFNPSALLVPDTNLIFIGVGERLLAYELDGPKKLWEDRTECGLLGWARHGDHIVMSAELELAEKRIARDPALILNVEGTRGVPWKRGSGMLASSSCPACFRTRLALAFKFESVLFTLRVKPPAGISAYAQCLPSFLRGSSPGLT